MKVSLWIQVVQGLVNILIFIFKKFFFPGLQKIMGPKTKKKFFTFVKWSVFKKFLF